MALGALFLPSLTISFSVYSLGAGVPDVILGGLRGPNTGIAAGPFTVLGPSGYGSRPQRGPLPRFFFCNFFFRFEALFFNNFRALTHSQGVFLWDLFLVFMERRRGGWMADGQTGDHDPRYGRSMNGGFRTQWEFEVEMGKCVAVDRGR